MIGRRLYANRSLTAKEQQEKISALPIFFDFIREDFFNPLEELTANSLRPALFKVGEKFLRRFRILVLKTENLLHRLSDYFRGRRIAIKNGNGNGKNGHFWNEMQKTKEEFAKNNSQNKENLPG